MASRSLLDHQADGIEYTLHSHGIEGNVVGGNISPRLIQFHVKLGSGTKFNRVANLADEIALALGVTSCRITRDGYYVKVEVPRPDPVAVQLFPLMRTLPGDLPPISPILGLDENGVPLLVRLTSPDIAHMLISGTTGSGKTALARSMIASLALQNQPEQLRLLLIDPKCRGYRQFEGLPNLVCPVITDPQDGLHRLRWAVRHMEKRDESGINTPSLVIFIDELADMMMVNGREMEYLITRLTQRGREAGIHVIACTQKPAVSVIGGIAKSNFPTRIVGRVVSAEDAKIASGVAGSGAEKLMGRGDFLLFSGQVITRLQGAYISPGEMEQTVVHLGGALARPAERVSERQVSRAERPVERPVEHSSERVIERPAKKATRTTSQPDYGEYYSEPMYEKPRRTEKPVARAEQPTRSRAHYKDYGYDEEAMGVTERFERYMDSIRTRRSEALPSKTAQPEKEQAYYNPARNYPRDYVEPELEEEEFEEEEEMAPPHPKVISRAAPKPVPKPVAKPAAARDLWDDDIFEDEPPHPASRHITPQRHTGTGRPSAALAQETRKSNGNSITADGGKSLMQQLSQRYQNNPRPR